MSTYLAKIRNEILPGSVADQAQKKSITLAEGIAGAKVIVLGDNSGSMQNEDVFHDGRRISREEKLMRELAGIYEQYPGQVLLIEFSTDVKVRPTGVFSGQHGSTFLAPALEKILPVDNAGVKFIILSDGQASDESECLAVARKFKSPLDCVYIGPESGIDAGGRNFLRQLASLAGGRFSVEPEIDVEKPIIGLLQEGR